MRKIYLLFYLLVITVSAFSAGKENKYNRKEFFAPFNVDQPADVTVCNGTTTSTITFTSSVPGNTFTWTNNNTSIGLGASGSGNIAPFTAINTGTTAAVATITVTPATGTPATFTITVNPIPTVNNVANQTVCRNSSTTAVNFSGTVPGTIYNWTNNNTAIGLAASGTGNIASFNATNSTNAPITSTVTVTPQFGNAVPDLLYYKFNGAGSTVPNNASNPPPGTATATINGNITQGGSGTCGGKLQSTRISTNDYLNTNWAANVNGSWTMSFITSGFSTVATGIITDVIGSINGTKPLYITYVPTQNGSLIVNNLFQISTNFSTTRTVTFVYDHAALRLQGYLDGVLVLTRTGDDFTINTNGFYIGNIDGGVVGSSTAGSSIDEFRMYSRALSLPEIQALVNSCNVSGACTGTPESFNITVYPDLVVNDPADQTICAGSATTAVNFTGTSGAVYNWTNNNPSIGLAASGTGNIPSFTPTFSGTSPVTATITVTPSFSGGPACTASSQTFTITINPIPDVNTVANQTVCNNAATTTINFSGTVPGTNYTWTNSNPSIGLPANGSGNIPSFTALNVTGSPVTGTITVTPSYGAIAVPEILYYKFDGSGTNVPNLASNPPPFAGNATIASANLSQGGSGICDGTLIGSGFTGAVSTNWQPGISGSWTISLKTSNISTTTNNGAFCRFGDIKLDGNGNDWTLRSSLFADLVATGGSGLNTHTNTFVYDASALTIKAYVDGVLINTVSVATPIVITPGADILLLGTSIGSRPLPAGGLLDEFRLYNRALSAGEVANIANNCNPVATCTGSPEIFGITVNPSPVVDPVSSQNTCTGNNTSAINFTGNIAGATYNWVNSNPSIGLAASGTGNIPSFTAINAGSTTEVATITVTPVSPTQPSCPGTPEIFTISVSPVPAGTASPASQTVCSESAISNILFTGNVPGITFDWTRDNLTTVTGIPGVGNGNISGTLTNTTNTPVTVIFTVTPSIGGCVGTPFIVRIIVNESLPTATVSPSSQTICSGNITDIVPSSNYAGATFSWTRDNTATVTGIPASGTGTISGTLFNTTTSPVTVTFTITPSINGCDGAPVTATVLVNAVPTITCPLSFSVTNTPGLCGRAVTYNTSVTGAPAPTLSYTLSGATTGSGSGNGSGSLFNVGETTVTVTATNICGTASCSFRITVLDTENPVITCPANIQANTDAGICAGTVATPNPVTADNCVVIKQTWTLSGATTGSSPSAGINNTGTRLFNKGTTTVTYSIEDAAGNQASCSYTVTIRDAEVPVVICPANITVTTQAGLCSAEVAYTVNATDNCPGVTTQLVSGLASGSVFPLGVTTVTWRAIDAATNISTNCSFTVTVLDGQLPVISQQPVNSTVCAGSSATFSVTATTAPNTGGPIAYQWQQWNGQSWNNIAGATTASYTVNNVTVAMNTNTFRVVLTGLCTVVNSASASLFVNPLPSVSISFNSLSQLQPAQNTAITSIVSPAGGTYTWRRNNNVVIGAGNQVLDGLTVDHLGTYQLTYTDLNGCVSNSGTLVLSALESPKIWVHPSPNNGRFQVRYYNSIGEPVSVRVFNSAGQLVYSRELVTGNNYSRIDVDLGNQSQGVYFVKIYDTKSRELAAKKIVVYR